MHKSQVQIGSKGPSEKKELKNLSCSCPILLRIRRSPAIYIVEIWCSTCLRPKKFIYVFRCEFKKVKIEICLEMFVYKQFPCEYFKLKFIWMWGHRPAYVRFFNYISRKLIICQYLLWTAVLSLTSPWCMEECTAMHKCCTMDPLHRNYYCLVLEHRQFGVKTKCLKAVPTWFCVSELRAAEGL